MDDKISIYELTHVLREDFDMQASVLSYNAIEDELGSGLNSTIAPTSPQDTPEKHTQPIGMVKIEEQIEDDSEEIIGVKELEKQSQNDE